MEGDKSEEEPKVVDLWSGKMSLFKKIILSRDRKHVVKNPCYMGREGKEKDMKWGTLHGVPVCLVIE